MTIANWQKGSILLLVAMTFHFVSNVRADNISILGTTTEWIKDRDNVLTLEIQVPEGASGGDLLVLFIGTSGKKPDVPFGNGGPWTLIDRANKANEGDDSQQFGNCSLYAYYKAYDPNGGDTVSYAKGQKKFASLSLLRGADLQNPAVDWGFDKSVTPKVAIGDDGHFDSPSVKTEEGGVVFVACQYDDKVLSRKVTVDGQEIPTLIYNQHGDDTLVIAADENTDGSKTGDAKLYWTGNDTRTSIVYGIAMTLSIRAGDASGDWLKKEIQKQITGCKIKSSSGIWLHTPDGIGHYKALWTRDYYYFVKYGGDFITDANVKASILYILNGQRKDGCIPDRVKADGKAIYSPGGETRPMADHALDNAPFLALLACEYVHRTGDYEFLKSIESKLQKGLDHIRRGENGLVYNPPESPQCVYGFTDVVTKTGHLLFTSLLYYQACDELDKLGKKHGGDPEFNYRARADLIKKHISILWDDKAGMFFAADKDCRQIDIWGSAFAVEVGIATGKQQERIGDYFLAHWDEIVQHGQVRHLPGKQSWQRFFGDRRKTYPLGTYQNGAYWATPLPWVVPVIAHKDPAIAKQMVKDVIEDFKTNDVAECINGDYRKVPNFVVSITNLYAVSSWLTKKN